MCSISFKPARPESASDNNEGNRRPLSAYINSAPVTYHLRHISPTLWLHQGVGFSS